MSLIHIARQFGGVATYREEDRGDNAGAGGGEGGADKDAEAAAAEKAAADKAARDAEISIPKPRFDAALKKERERAEAAEKKARELEEAAAAARGGKDAAKIEAEIDGLYDDLDKALADNNQAEKKRIRAEIRQREQALAGAERDQSSAMATALAVEQVRYDGEIDRLEADYPFLREETEDNPNEEFNKELFATVVVMKKGFEAQGLSSSAALKRARAALKPQLDAAKKAEASGDEDAAAKAAEEAKAKAATAEEKRRADAVAKGAAAAQKQPGAKPGEAGTPDKKAKVLPPMKDMSDKDFEALPDAEKKRLRGDDA